MPATRPAAGTAIINTADTVGNAAAGYWLVDAAGNPPDLKAAQPALTISGSLTYATTGPLGGHLTGAGGTSGVTSNPLANTIAAYPYYIGCSFVYSSGTPGDEAIAGLGDATMGNGGIYAYILVSGGTYGTSGHIVGVFRTVENGTVSVTDGPLVVTGTAYHCAFKVINGEGTSASAILVVNGSVYTPGAGGAGDFSANSLGNFSTHVLHRPGLDYYNASNKVDIAQAWYARPTVTLTQTDLVNWTNDPWNSLTVAGGGSASLSRIERGRTLGRGLGRGV